MDNIEQFNQGAALILDHLYTNFPVGVVVDLSKLAPDVDNETRVRYGATLEFLVDEGFIRGGKPIANGFLMAHAVLTTKGLAILNSVPDALQEKVPLGARIGSALRSGAKGVLNTLITEAIKMAASGQLQSLQQRVLG